MKSLKGLIIKYSLIKKNSHVMNCECIFIYLFLKVKIII